MMRTLKCSVMLLVSMIGLTTFTSCDDDDDKKGPETPTTKVVAGEYTGTMTYTIEAKTESEGETVEPTTLEIKVNNDTIYFDEFPVGALVYAIIKDSASAEDIIKNVENLKYNVGYSAALNAANDSVALTLKPEPLTIDLEKLGISVSVTVVATEVGSYSIENKSLKFKLEATEAKLGETNALQAPILLSFDMKKK